MNIESIHDVLITAGWSCWSGFASDLRRSYRRPEIDGFVSVYMDGSISANGPYARLHEFLPAESYNYDDDLKWAGWDPESTPRLLTLLTLGVFE